MWHHVFLFLDFSGFWCTLKDWWKEFQYLLVRLSCFKCTCILIKLCILHRHAALPWVISRFSYMQVFCSLTSCPKCIWKFMHFVIYKDTTSTWWLFTRSPPNSNFPHFVTARICSTAYTVKSLKIMCLMTMDQCTGPASKRIWGITSCLRLACNLISS